LAKSQENNKLRQIDATTINAGTYLRFVFRAELGQLAHVECLLVLVLRIYLPGIITSHLVDLCLQGAIMIVDLLRVQLHRNVLINELLDLPRLHGFSPIGADRGLGRHVAHIRLGGRLLLLVIVGIIGVVMLLVVLLGVLMLVGVLGLLVAIIVWLLLAVVHSKKWEQKGNK
jgi:hypothetical protein